MIKVYWARREHNKRYHAFTDDTRTLCGQKIEVQTLSHIANELPKGAPVCINCDHAVRKLKREAQAQKKRKEKPLQYWNGRDPLYLSRGHTHAYLVAHSKAEAVRIGQEAFGHLFTMGELNTYWSPCWGTPAEQALGIPTEPGAYISIDHRFYKYIGSTKEPW